MTIRTFADRRRLRDGIRNADLDNNFSFLVDEIAAAVGGAGPGIAVAGGKITSDGSGAQSVANCFGVSSCTIFGTAFRVTLSTAIATNNDMVVTLGCGTSFVQLSAAWTRISDTKFDVYLTDNTPTSYTLSGLWFGFSVFNAGA